MEGKSLDPFERRETELEEAKEQVCEEQGRRGQYNADVDDIEPLRRGKYIAGADGMDSPRGTELIDNERITS
jgi:hypothetical protein